MLEAFFSIGPTFHTGMGEAPVPWSEIAAWTSATGTVLDPDEAETVVSMSRAYLNARHEGMDPHSIPPIKRPDADEFLDA